MTPAQYTQWRDFAVRMARTCYATSRRPTGAWILEQVEEFIYEFVGDYMAIVDWDTSTDGDMALCDAMADFESDAMPHFYFVDDTPDDDDWCEPEQWQQRCDDRAERARQQWTDQYMGPVACCVRAGLDMATRITGGVVGFTVGDLRAMYPEGIPDFVQRHYQGPLAHPADGAEPVWL